MGDILDRAGRSPPARCGPLGFAARRAEPGQEFSSGRHGHLPGTALRTHRTEIMTEATGRSPAAIGHFRLRNPVKPLTLGEFASARTESRDGGLGDRSATPEAALRL